QEREHTLEREQRAREAAEAFLAVMSHEVKTRVTTIYGAAALLSREALNDSAREMARDVAEESARLARIVDDLLVLSGVERGLIRLAPEPVAVRHVLKELLT